jgi:hypothetical protein
VEPFYLHPVNDLRFEAITEHHGELIHYYIPALAAGPAIREVADIEEQDFDHGVIVREHLAAGDVFPHL